MKNMRWDEVRWDELRWDEMSKVQRRKGDLSVCIIALLCCGSSTRLQPTKAHQSLAAPTKAYCNSWWQTPMLRHVHVCLDGGCTLAACCTSYPGTSTDADAEWSTISRPANLQPGAAERSGRMVYRIQFRHKQAHRLQECVLARVHETKTRNRCTAVVQDFRTCANPPAHPPTNTCHREGLGSGGASWRCSSREMEHHPRPAP